MMSMEIDYNEQMLNYYPEIIKAIREFQALVRVQSWQVAEMHYQLTKILGNAYIGTADESTIEKWEATLGIVPLEQGSDSLEVWLQDRKEVILARLYQTEKLNEKSISEIVQIFTGGGATSHFKDGVIYVEISPPKNNKQYKFANVERELSKKIPAHLSFQVDVNYYLWLEIKERFLTWNDLYNSFASWEDGVVQTL